MAATDRNEIQQLDPRRLRAIDLLAEGQTDAIVADAVGVDRSTVWRWRTRDPAFRAELARRREELWRSSTDRLRALLPRASEVVAAAIDEGDHHAALALLKLGGVGDLDLGRAGPTEPDIIVEVEVRERARREHDRLEAEVHDAERASQLEMRRAFANLGPGRSHWRLVASIDSRRR